MVLYGLALVPLAKSLKAAVPDVHQPWYADDCAMVGPSTSIGQAMDLLLVQGPARGYFPEPSKSVVVCPDATRPQVHENLARFAFRYADGHEYIGGFIGSNEARLRWLEPKIERWV